MKKFTPPRVCPACGEDVPRDAKACPSCGACPKSGWSDDALYDGVDLPDNDFNYEKFVAEEFGSGKKKSDLPAIWWIVAIITFVAFICLYVLHGR